MAYKNSVSVYIDGINRTSNTVMPLKYGNFLDERLDECYISLRGIKKQNFAPLTPVEIVIHEEEYFGVKNKSIVSEKQHVEYYIVANDNVTEMQIGKGVYNHELYCIEITKIAECYVVDTLTYTNDLGRSYTQNPTPMTEMIGSGTRPGTYKGRPSDYRSPINTSDSLRIQPFSQIWGLGSGIGSKYKDITIQVKDEHNAIIDELQNDSAYSSFTVSNLRDGTYTIVYNGKYAYDGATTEIVTPYPTVTYTFGVVENKLPLKRWTVTDVIKRLLDLAEPLRKGETSRFILNAEQAERFDKIIAPEFSFTKQTLRECLQEVGKFIHGEPRLTPKKDEILTKIEDRTFVNGRASIGNLLPAVYDLNATYKVSTSEGMKTATIIRVTDKPGSVLPPEYFLRLADNSTYSGPGTVYSVTVPDWYYEVSYDMFAGEQKSGVWFMPYTSKSSQHAIENYASYLDSHAQNLVNQLDKYSGVIIEPYKGGAKSVRTENLYVRIEEGNMLIPTQYPIYDVQKLEYVYATDKDPLNLGTTVLKSVDITPYVFERSEYDGRLSSYDGTWPYSKMYALYFSQGSKNIQGLNFKVPSASNAAGPFKYYAIVNILRRATGDDSLFPFEPFDPQANNQYPKMCFRVTYTPFYDARVAQTKTYYKDFKRPAALIFNQQSNVIESRYYGENLKGAIARLGNIDVSLTYIFGSLRFVPKAGQKFNKDYYISAVAVEIFPTCVKCTVGLSKDFNRLSQYIGISSVKRYYEVSQTQAVERNTLYREYIVVGEKEEPDEDTLGNQTMLVLVGSTFNPLVNEGELVDLGPITNVIAHGASYNGGPLNTVNLPVVSSAFGNSMSFSWKYEDNYSAGAVADYQSNANVSGYFQNNYRYVDYYGRMYYYYFDLYERTPEININNFESIGQHLPKGEKATYDGFVSTGNKPFILRKDNREALQVNYQIDFVTNIETLIIGSALASHCPAVRGVDTSLTPADLRTKLYVFPDELNKFTDHVEAFTNVDLDTLPSANVNAVIDDDGYLVLSAGNFPAKGKSWAIVMPQRKTSATVQDEEGNESTQTVFYGGDLLIGQNIEVKSGQAFTPIYFTLKREIFDKSVWKDRR